MAAYAYEYANVTQHGNIDFLKGISSGQIFVEANAIHKGSRSVVNRVEVTSSDGVLLAAGSFTMYLLSAL
jgi:acyl-coenzyme A thioesterase PaaI-like protein